MGKKKTLGNRMKDYELAARFVLPRRTFTIVRCDGRSFSNYTKGLDRPFDAGFVEDMNSAAIALCEDAMNVKFGFVQSDEITIVMTDFENPDGEAWFDNEVQKVCSSASSTVSTAFNKCRLERLGVNKMKWGKFDARMFQVHSRTEVINNILWRQQDTTRNSIQAVVYSLYPHKQVEGKNTDQMQEMAFQKGVNWNDLDPKLKRGRLITKEQYEHTSKDKEGNPVITLRSRWVAKELPIISKDPDFIRNLLPQND